MYLCKIENGTVSNRAKFDDQVPDGWIPEGETWIANDEAQIGWLYADGVFSEPPPPPPPPPVVPSSITARQGKITLLRMGLMTADEAISGAVPAFLSGTMQNMKPEEAAELFLTWRDAAVWYRSDPLFGGSLLAAASAALNMPATDQAVDQFFITASAI